MKILHMNEKYRINYQCRCSLFCCAASIKRKTKFKQFMIFFYVVVVFFSCFFYIYLCYCFTGSVLCALCNMFFFLPYLLQLMLKNFVSTHTIFPLEFISNKIKLKKYGLISKEEEEEEDDDVEAEYNFVVSGTSVWRKKV